MDSFWERLHAERISHESAALITGAERQETNCHYESAWHKWYRWCTERGWSHRCSINILQFLTENFHTGYTIIGFSSAISADHDPINGVPVGKESQVTALLEGVHKIRPP